MLAGLLFAVRDAEDRSGKLAATLPFGGLTLIEYQARLLAGLGVSQIIVIIARLTPELRGAIARTGRRGVTVDAVSTAAEAAAKLHPLAGLVMLADGLVTTEAVIAPLMTETSDTLLVLDESEAPSVFERIGGRTAWAGVARLARARLKEVAALPAEYDVQSSLLRAAAQAGAMHVVLANNGIRSGHGIELRGDALDSRGCSVMASMLSAKRGWFDRWIVAPIARPLLTQAMRRGVATIALAAVAGGLAAGGLFAIHTGYWASGAVAAAAGAIVASAGATLASLRDEAISMRGFAATVFAIPALALLLLGHAIDQTTDQASGRILAVVMVAAAALGERAATEHSRRFWWGSPPAYLAMVTVATIAGRPLVGLGLAGAYAALSLASAIEMLRRDP